GLPRDPNHTAERVRGGVMRVGITEAAPWTRRTTEGFDGVEVELAEAFARTLGARVDWVPGAEAELMEALEVHQLELVIGGLRADSTHAPRVGLTRPYVSSDVRVGVPPGAAPPPHGLEGLQVAVRRGSSTAHVLEKEGAVALPMPDPGAFPGARAAPDWQLDAWNYQPRGPVLAELKGVMAVPPGENRWLLLLDTFLSEQAPSLLQRLVRETR
ncbi:MAG TPA: transporter substrate-binding domain-containing protein, partial [Myxococcaceae bacterium]|nr:transporter substrate-binding domain-containing protein [Myxococcaceae bacterium]